MADLPEVDYEGISLRLSSVFQPAAPINSEKLFRGRISQIRAVVDAINQPGRHAILFGGRGVGKTSLGKTLRAKLTTAEPVPVLSPLITCDSSDDYSTVWTKVFAEIEYQASNEQPADPTIELGHIREVPLDWTPFEVRRRIESLARRGILYIVLDEFDKVVDRGVRQLIADTIKVFSDHAVNATLIVIGVSDDATGLIEDHRSIARCLAQIPMPRMPQAEIGQIVTLGLKKVGMAINEDALYQIIGLSKGLPSYAHLLALHASREALDRRTLTVQVDHVQHAIKVAISQTEETIRTDYDNATYSSRKTLHSAVLLACAMAKTDEFGRFQPNDVCGPMREVTGEEYTSDRFSGHLKQFCEVNRGAVLKKTGGEYRWRYQFRNPLLQPFVLMKGLDAGLVSKEVLDLRMDDERYPLFNRNQRK